MISRRLPYATDYITPTQSVSLRRTLAGFLPPSSDSAIRTVHRLASSHHLVYFPNVPPSSLLLPDGTDSLHSPGPPFTRRVWAGGSMAFLRNIEADGQPFHCTESIDDVQVKGKEGEEKIFVRVKRIILPGRYPGKLKGQRNTGLHVAEHRTLVFMRDNPQEGSPAVSQSSSKALKPPHTPEASHTMVPTRELLFRFSALTLNAHAIHLDKQFCREVEGHRNLLVHGPLTVVLMIEFLQNYLRAIAERCRFSMQRSCWGITQIEYRNLAPLYAEEEMKICVRRREEDIAQGRGVVTWDVWIEGQDGGYAVKGIVTTALNSTMLDELFPPLRFKGSLGGETIPEEQVAFQKAVNTMHETVSDKESSLEEDEKTEEKTERETEGKTKKGTEE